MFLFLKLIISLILLENAVANTFNTNSFFNEEQLKSIKDAIAEAQSNVGNVRKEVTDAAPGVSGYITNSVYGTADCSGKPFFQYTLNAMGACQFLVAANAYVQIYLDSLTTCSMFNVNAFGPTDTKCTTLVTTTTVNPRLYYGLTSTINTCSTTNGFANLGYGTITCTTSPPTITAKPNIVASLFGESGATPQCPAPSYGTISVYGGCTSIAGTSPSSINGVVTASTSTGNFNMYPSTDCSGKGTSIDLAFKYGGSCNYLTNPVSYTAVYTANKGITTSASAVFATMAIIVATTLTFF